MPGARDDCELAFVAIDAEILVGFMVCIQSANGNDLHAGAEDSIPVERFLQPEML